MTEKNRIDSHYKTARNRDRDKDSKMIGFAFAITLCIIHTTQGQGTIAVADPGFPRGGGANSPGEAPTYDFANFPQKLHEIERIRAPGGERAPLRSATALFSIVPIPIPVPVPIQCNVLRPSEVSDLPVGFVNKDA